jgi:formylglycine-generating enzyme required for sulfatase activity
MTKPSATVTVCTDMSQRLQRPRRVVRGGSWNKSPDFVRSAFRYWTATDTRASDLGFRVARTLIAP